MNSLNSTLILNSQVKHDTVNVGQPNEATASSSNVDLNNNNEHQHQRAQAPAEPARAAAPPQPAANAAGNDGLGEREDDWLGTLHNIVSFLVLFSIIYYYSSLERFLVIFTIVLALIM